MTNDFLKRIKRYLLSIKSKENLPDKNINMACKIYEDLLSYCSDQLFYPEIYADDGNIDIFYEFKNEQFHKTFRVEIMIDGMISISYFDRIKKELVELKSTEWILPVDILIKLKEGFCD